MRAMSRRRWRWGNDGRNDLDGWSPNGSGGDWTMNEAEVPNRSRMRWDRLASACAAILAASIFLVLAAWRRSGRAFSWV
jgi:hypothetical protein